MPDAFHDVAKETDDLTLSDEAAARAQQQLSTLEPAGSEPFHIKQDEVVTQTGEDPISDFTGRGNGP